MNIKSFLFFLLFVFPAASQTITDLIQPVIINSDEEMKILTDDLFFSDSYDLKFLPSENINVSYNKDNRYISISAKNNFSGFELVPFRLSEKSYMLPVLVVRTGKYIFSYKAQPGDIQINLFGQFNSWNRQNLPMKDNDGDGVYEIEIPLDPGRYEYKFFVDGKEITDPGNPVKVPNGLGDFNSVRIIEETGDNTFLHIIDSETNKRESRFAFYLSGSNTDNPIAPEHIKALYDNQAFPENNIAIIGKRIELRIDNKMSEGNHTIRVAVNYEGKCSNIQTIHLTDGRFAGSEGTPRTLNDQIIYSLMIDRFSNGDTTNDSPVKQDSLYKPANYNGGDLKGIIRKIEEGYFSNLGINTLWISPVIDNTNNAYREYPPPHRWYTGYHGYWPVSSTKVEEHFGNMNLLRDLINTAHLNGINVLLDYVSNHVHEEHPLWKEHRDWFGVLELPDGRKNLRLWDEFRLTTWFEPYMPSFDYTGSIEALEYMTDNAVWWLRVTNADGFRHDAVKHVPNEFWRLLTKKIKRNILIPEKKLIYQIGETFGGIDLIASYVNNGQLNAQFNFNLYDVAVPTFLDTSASFLLVDYQIKKTLRVFGYNNLMGNIMDSHDKIRFMAYADGDLLINDGKAGDAAWNNPPVVDKPESYKKLKLYIAFLTTIPGIPVIYYGDEIGMTGAADPDNRRMMRFDDQLNALENQTYNDVSKLISLRKNHPALRYGDFFTLQADENFYIYLRSDFNERILVVLNKNPGRKSAEINLPGIYNLKTAEDLLTNESVHISDDSFTVSTEGYGYKIFILN